MKASIIRRALLCPFGLCQTFKTGSDADGIWGECQKCGRRSGYVDRAGLREIGRRAELRAQTIRTSDMRFCGEPTADGDTAAEYMRAWYEAHRETDATRKGKPWDRGIADSFMLGLMNEARRIEDECDRQTKGGRS